MNKNFTLLKTEYIPEYFGKGTWLRHNKTGLEIFHVHTKRKTNMVAFNFRTPLNDDSGVAHVLEHSIFTENQIYPGTNIHSEFMKRSVSACNAMTGPFHTLFYGSSLVKKDFFNLVEFLGTLVFFPKLSEETFMQEGWHIEKNTEGNKFINGVVYNEMKDAHKFAYSGRERDKIIYGNGSLAYEAGGIYYEIPKLKSQDVKEFHKKNYVPANCLLFLSGNIPIEEEIDYIEEKICSRLPEKTKRSEICWKLETVGQTRSFDIGKPFVKSENCDIELNLIVTGQKQEDHHKFSYYMGLLCQTLEKKLVAPLYGIAAKSTKEGGAENHILTFTLFSVEPEKIEEAKKYMTEILEETLREGIPADVLATSCNEMDYYYESMLKDEMSADDMNRRSSHNWILFGDPFCRNIKNWQLIKKQLSEDPKECSAFLREKFMASRDRIFFVFVPEKEYLSVFEKKEQKILEKLCSDISDDEISGKLRKLHEFQGRTLTQAERNLIPHLSLEDVEDSEILEAPQISFVEGKYGPVPLVTFEAESENRSNVSLYFSMEGLSERECYDLRLDYSFLGDFGYGGMSNSETIDYFRNMHILCDMTFEPKLPVSKFRENGFAGKSFLSINGEFDNSRIDESLEAFWRNYYEPNFSDNEDMESLRKHMKEFYKEFGTYKGRLFAKMKLGSCLSAEEAFTDSVLGINQAEYFLEDRNLTAEQMIEKCSGVHQKVLGGNGFCFICASKEFMPVLKEKVAALVKKTGIRPLSDTKTAKAGWKEKQGKELFSVFSESDIGCALMAFKGSEYPSKEYAAENVLCVWMQNGELFERIRRKNGAYNVVSYVSNVVPYVYMSSSRDPQPKRSLEMMQACLEEIAGMEFTEEQVENMIIKAYGEFQTEVTEGEKGEKSLERLLMGLSPEFKSEFLKNTKALTAADIHAAAVRMHENSRSLKACIVSADESQLAGKIIWDERKDVIR